MSKREVRTVPVLELRIAPEATDGTRTLTGTAIVFNQRSKDLGGFVEVISPDAVTNTLSSGSNIWLLKDHSYSQPIASTASGTLALKTDSRGVSFTAKLDTRQSYVNDLALSISSGVTSGMSFGFRSLKDSYTEDNGLLVRQVEKLELYELTVTPVPAYTQTQINIRSVPKELRSLLHRSDSSDDEDDCDCERDEDGNLVDPDSTCDDEDEDRSKRSVLVNESERSRMMLKIEIAKRK
jgi:HK97 family phage prohead protease